MTQTTENYLSHPKGILSWLYTLDHKRIGLMYAIGVTASFFLGGVYALLVRLELWSPGKTIMDATQYNQAFTLHGAVMIFLVLIPAIPGIFGNFMIPLQIGARDVAFPRLNLWSFYLYAIGLVIALSVLFMKQPETGWTFYTPYASQTNSAVIPLLLAAFVLGFSGIFSGLNFMVTIHQLRAKGLTWFRLPLFVWSIYATAIIQILATPVLGITLVLLIVERVAKIGIFDPALGGDPLLFQHFFWFYSHPAVYVMILPAMGIISEIIPTFSQKPIFGYKYIAFSSITIALIGFFVWGHHMFTSGQSPVASMIFSALTFLVSIPSGIKVFNWVATMYKGSIRFDSPFLFAVSFIILFCIGGFTGVMLGVISLDVHFQDTYFVVAHFHYTMLGSTLMAFVAAIHYWWPKMFGKLYHELSARIACGLIFVGFNITFFPQFILGAKGMPRRYYDYIPEFTALNRLSTVGSWILAAGFLVMLAYLIHSLVRGKKSPANPWDGTTLEWTTSSPPPTENFDTLPTVTRGPYGIT